MRPILILALLLPMASQAAPRLGFVTFGPMMHFNFGKNAYLSFSWGLEAAYWIYEAGVQEEGFIFDPPEIEVPGWGAAVGFEVDRDAIRYYLEPQVGWVLAGFSLGSVLEVPREEGSAHWGLQGSGWLNSVLGFDLRYRRVAGRNFQALGMYAKLPRLVSGEVPPAPD